MRFPDPVTILRATEADEYGNPGRSWTTPTETDAVAFVTHGGNGSKALMPPGTDVLTGDRLRMADGATFAVGEAHTVRSPSRSILTTAVLTRVEA